ncbi:ABC transporter ATP-binding protein/permease [Limibaculum sp. FT325]|uniref:ABC transporter ATP-binding protein n=1 Tax=Thermohalobaculum sediminis TaxID=2939436 RepID=UPI0020C0A0D9|nr:ABC transporter ATP-binding protein [Limibaculum sediminis]MCL5776058.1 ABC transporter ATP-binding protein/permease [Limibaculum sediminis]
MSFFERLIDPFARAGGPPPRSAGAFARWMLRGTGAPLGWFTLVAVLLGAAEAVAALLVAWLVDRAALGPGTTFLAEHWPETALILLFFLGVRPALMSLSSGFVSRALGPGLFLLGTQRLHHHTLGQSMEFFNDDFAGRIVQKEVQTGLALSDAVTESINAVTYGIAAVIGSALVLIGTDWRLFVPLAIWAVAYGWLVRRYLPRIRRLSRAKAETRAGITGQFVDSISHMQTVKLFAHAEREEAAAEAAMARHWQTALGFGRVVWQFRTLLAILAGILPAAMIGMAIWLWTIGATGPGAIALAGLISTRLSQMSGWISFTAMGIFANAGVVEDGMRTLSPPHAVTDRDGALDPDRIEGAIAFEGVSFGYGRPEGGGVSGLDLHVAPGEKVALVGPSGAGKSTTIALLLRLYDVESGRITIDGHDIRDLTQNGLRRHIATVTQEAAIFNRSALDNILYGRPDAGREAAIEAARRVRAHDFILGLGDGRGRRGYEAHLGEDGVKLSGGQRQRIALARAVLKDAPILVFDEATSSLDSEVEAEIQAALEVVMEGKTVIAIAHRLSTIQRMDRIIVLDGGRVVESGTHADLLAAQGLYARLWARQSGGFIDAGDAMATEAAE